jgi:hypothetical protein
VRILNAKRRSWDAYLAGIGASGALMASALVMFVVLVGLVTFNAWPHAGSLLGPGAGSGVLGGAAKPATTPGPARSSTLNLATLLGGGATPRQGGARTGSGGIGSGVNPGGIGEAPGGSEGPGGGEPQGAQPPPSSPAPPRDAVSQTVSAVGDTVQSTTDSVGDTLGGSNGPGLGGVVGGLGRTLNNDIQSLAGGR